LQQDVQEELLHETSHVFIGGHGQLGEFLDLDFQPDEVVDGSVRLRMVFLSERVMDLAKDEALWTVAREIGHS